MTYTLNQKRMRFYGSFSSPALPAACMLKLEATLRAGCVPLTAVNAPVAARLGKSPSAHSEGSLNLSTLSSSYLRCFFRYFFDYSVLPGFFFPLLSEPISKGCWNL